MMFNNDLFDVIAEADFGFTIPQSLTTSSMYRYMLKNGYCDKTGGPVLFITDAILDERFVEAACQSVDVCKWILRTLQGHNLTEDHFTMFKQTKGMSRIILVTDDKEAIEDLMLDNMDELSIEFYYAHMTIEQLKWVKLTDPRYLFINKFSICRTIGRLDVMKLIFEWYPAKFEFLKNAVLSVGHFIYQSVYDRRQIETLDWLISTFNLQFTEVDKYCELDSYLSYDLSLGHWMIVNHLDKVKTKLALSNERRLFYFILEHYEARTMQAYIESCAKSPAFLDSRHNGVISYLYSITPKE